MRLVRHIRCLFPATSLIVVLLLAVGGCGDSGGNFTGDQDTGRDVRFDSWIFDTPAPPDGVVAPDAPDGENVEQDVPVEPQCSVDNDCIPHLPRPGQCEVRSCVAETNTCAMRFKPDGAPCDDGNPCSAYDTCQQGLCTAGDPICTCRLDADCAVHEDGNLCNGTLVCNLSVVPYTCDLDDDTKVVCDTSLDTPCRETACVPETGECVAEPANEGALCDDEDPCTGDSRCTADGDCVGEDRCQCRVNEDCLPFEDGDRCNGILFCDLEAVPHVCKILTGSEITCLRTDDTDCMKNRCQPGSGTCALAAMPDTSPCQDGNACTLNDACAAGVCRSGAQKDCDDGNPCTNDGCNLLNGQCTHGFNTSQCEALYACSLGDVCSQGQCRRGTTLNCDDDDPCTEDTCVEPDGCVNTFSEVLCPPPDVSEPDIVAPPDVPGPPDVSPPDIWVDPWAPVDRAIFRWTSATWVAPALCYYYLPTEPCIPITQNVADRVDERLVSGAGAAQLLTVLTPLDMDSAAATAEVGPGTCDEGAPPTCDLRPEGPTTAWSPVSYARDAYCVAGGTIDPPCFSTDGVTWSLDVFDAPVTLSAVSLGGGLVAGYTELRSGVVRGFLPVLAASETPVTITGLGTVTVDLLFGDVSPVTHDEVQGWWIELGYEAERAE